jgi:hypothetical protein
MTDGSEFESRNGEEFLYSAEIKKTWTYAPTLPYVFMQ